MSGALLNTLLWTHDGDPGCATALERLHLFADLTAAGADAAAAHPDVATHLTACPACARDFQGLLAAIGCDVR
ncbi:MAG TPA: hypothetical protein VL422_16285 [Miltoncostaea sp.]|nr:hypothetical protein [Miltoncostaea sp.]